MVKMQHYKIYKQTVISLASLTLLYFLQLFYKGHSLWEKSILKPTVCFDLL